MTTSPKLLRGESPLQVLPELATWIGLNEAIALQQLHYLLSQDNKGMVEDDIKWYRSSAQEWRDEHFKFWDVKVVERTFKNLEDDGFIKARTFTGRSKWYAIDYEAVEQIDRQVPRLTGKKDKRKKASEASIRTKCTNSNEGNEGPEGKTLEEGISTKCTNGLVQNVPTISTKCTTSKNPKNSFKKVSPKGDSGKKPQEDSKKWNNVNKKIVGDKFLELTQVPFPTNPKTKGVWYGWLFEIFELANKDPAETCRIITLVVKDMQKKHLTISSPKSLHWGGQGDSIRARIEWRAKMEHNESMAALRRQIDQNRLQERLRWQTKLQQLSNLSPEQAAIALNRKCAHCGQFLTPTAQPNEWRGGTHWVWPDEHDCEAARVAKEQQEAQEKVAKMTSEQKEYCKRLHTAGLIGWLAEATFASYSAREDWAGAEDVWRRVRDYTKAIEAGKREQPFLILHGLYGNGKSHLAASAIRYFLDKGQKRCYFRVWPDYLARIQATFNREEGETEEEIVAELQQGEIIVIDDLDKRKPSDWVRGVLFSVLNHRYNQGLPTILTLNYGPHDLDPKAAGRLALEEYMGRAVLDRVIGGAFDVIEFNGPSFRSGLKWQ